MTMVVMATRVWHKYKHDDDDDDVDGDYDDDDDDYDDDDHDNDGNVSVGLSTDINIAWSGKYLMIIIMMTRWENSPHYPSFWLSLVALHFTPVSGSRAGSEFQTSVASRLAS